jgi:hypothetical protein
MANSLGVLTVDLVAKIANFQSDMGKAAASSEAAAKRITSAFKGLAIGAAVTAVVATIEQAVASAIQYADALDNMSQRTGVSVTELSRLRVAAQFSDTSIEDLQGSFVKLAKIQAEAASGGKLQAQIFSSLGVATKNADGSLRSTTDVLADLADVFKSLGNDQGPTKAALAVEIFGKAGAQIIPLLNQGSDGLKQFNELSDRLGLTLDSTTTTAAAAFHDNLDTLKLVAEGLATQLAAELLPTLQEFSQGLADAASNKENIEALGHALRYLYDTLSLIKNLGSTGGSILGALNDSVDVTLKAAESFGKSLRGDNSENVSGPAAAAEGFRKAWAPVLANIQKQADQANNTLQHFGEKNKFAGVRGGVVDDSDLPNGGGVLSQAEARRRALAALASQQTIAGQSKAAVQAEALAKRIQAATESMAEGISNLTSELNKTGIPAVDAYNAALARLDVQDQKFLDQGVPVKQVAEYEEQMEKLAAAIRDAAFETEQLASHQSTLDLQAQAKDAEAAAQGIAGLAVANRNYEKQLEALDKQLNSNAITPEDYQASLTALDTIHKKNIDDIKKGYDEMGQFAIKAAQGIQESIADALSGDAVKGGFKGFLDGLGDMLRKAAAQIVAADLAKYLFGNYDKTGQVGGLFGNLFGGSSTSSGNASTASSSSTGGGWLSGLGSYLTGLFGRAVGGPVFAGQGYIVGEHGPEFFRPNSSGRIDSNGSSSKWLGPQRSIQQTNNYLLPGRVDQRTQAQLAQTSGRAAARAVARNS